MFEDGEIASQSLVDKQSELALQNVSAVKAMTLSKLAALITKFEA
jgi:hypothetical protein